MPKIRILFLADTHLGFDLPFRPRIQVRRRGPDFFQNFETVLNMAVAKKVDCIVHGGDLFYRSRVPKRLVEMVFEPLLKVADTGIPILIVPGNHERSVIPHSEFSIHPNIHVFTYPRTFFLSTHGCSLALSGFPFIKHNIRDRFPTIVHQTGWQNQKADCRLLCMHQSVAGARVGPANFMFRGGMDVIRAQDIPSEFSAILSGHIHRHQVLVQDLSHNQLISKVFYPGAIDRVSFAERDEAKGFLILTIDCNTHKNCQSIFWKFHHLPTRPMVIINLQPGQIPKDAFVKLLQAKLVSLPVDAIVKVKISGKVPDNTLEALRAQSLRSLAKPGMNISSSWSNNG